MNIQNLLELTTGDWVKNTQTGEVYMIAAVSPHLPYILVIEDLIPTLADWKLFQSRLVITKEQLKAMEEYHKKLDIKKEIKERIKERLATI